VINIFIIFVNNNFIFRIDTAADLTNSEALNLNTHNWMLGTRALITDCSDTVIIEEAIRGRENILENEQSNTTIKYAEFITIK